MIIKDLIILWQNKKKFARPHKKDNGLEKSTQKSIFRSQLKVVDKLDLKKQIRRIIKKKY